MSTPTVQRRLSRVAGRVLRVQAELTPETWTERALPHGRVELPSKGMKAGVYIGLLLLEPAGAFTYQNSAVMEARFLSWTLSASRAAFTFLTFAMGLFGGAGC